MRLEVEGDVLVVFVRERPAIAQIDFSGMKEFEPDNVRKVLRELGVAEGRIFDRAVLDAAEQELKRQYLSRGMYAASVQTTVTPLERNRVGINIAVTEGEVAKIRGINIVGAQAFSESELLGLFVLRTPGWLTWYTKPTAIRASAWAADLETLRSFYLNRGYLDFSLDSTQVSITPDRRDIYITINIVEGETYTVSDVTLAGQMLLPREELEAAGRAQARRHVLAREARREHQGDRRPARQRGLRVRQRQRDSDRRQGKAHGGVQHRRRPGPPRYVRRIDVAGNTKTRDEVVRRELRQLEGAYYDASKIQLSRRRIDRTNFFSEVTVETVPVEGSPDQVDVVYTVKEKATGALLLGVGFSSIERIALSASITQSNVFGTGSTSRRTSTAGA